MPIAATNDFVVKFANINGSGSASANELFARSILRMGIPVASRNIFPSNIQGLPTWYEVRVSGDGWLGRRGGVDLMVAMNPQTWNKDVGEIETGGYLLYDSTKPLTTQKTRDDITLLGVPLTTLSNSLEGTIPRERQLLRNVIYLGALSSILGFEASVVESLVKEQFPGKDKLIKLNMKAIELGHDYAEKNLKGLCKLRPCAPTRWATASSSAATTRRGLARFMAVPRCAPGIRSRRPPRWPKPSRRTAKPIASIRRRNRTTSPSCRRKTRSPPSAW
jgi:2-oxoglutarate ferredoxin oxidoreductase subunit alpha